MNFEKKTANYLSFFFFFLKKSYEILKGAFMAFYLLTFNPSNFYDGLIYEAHFSYCSIS